MNSFTMNCLVLMVILTFLFATVDVASKSSKKRSYKILEGDNLLVICHATDSPDMEVYWTKNDTKSTFKQKGKRLEILNISRAYSGDYICHLINTSFPVTEYNETANVTIDVINVDVEYPAEIDHFSIGPYELMENETFTVTCDFQAHPYPVWSIRNRDTGNAFMSATLPASATLTSPGAQCDDMGFWECTGSNVLNDGVNVTRGHNITVYCPPRPQYAKNRYVIPAKVGHRAELNMYLQAYPRASYTWTKDDETNISSVTEQYDVTKETRLAFANISVAYFGNYTLKMQNKYGTYFARYQIVADGAPETPTNLHFSDVTYHSVKLQWTSGFDMGSRQHFIVVELLEKDNYNRFSERLYDNSTNHGINQNWTYVLNGLASDTHYNLSVLSENERGFRSSTGKPSLVFRTKKNPYNYETSEPGWTLLLGISLGTIVIIGMLAFIVYMVKYRRLRTSYISIVEKPGIILKTLPNRDSECDLSGSSTTYCT